MKLSLHWLSDFIQWKERAPAVIADQLTLKVAEVEEVESQGALLDHCCVGKVLKIQKHPNADRLLLVDVQTDKGKKRVVCGGTNVREGMLVAFAYIGATVRWHGTQMQTLEPVNIRGEASEGMICAAEELDLIDRFPTSSENGEHPIIDLSGVTEPRLRVGMPLSEALGTDTIFHVSNTAITHRPDLFSHIGFARELVAAGIGSWKDKKEPAWKMPKFPDAAMPFTVGCPDKHLVPRYLACTIEMESLGETPAWMKKRLEAVSVRPISLPVDITNYVMLEEGSPLHAFDAAKIRGSSIIFREAESGETVTTLDGVNRTLPDGAIVLSDDAGIFDLCGLMGDLRTATTDSTRHLFLHAPVFDPIHTRRTIQTTGLRSDASTIFEKGVPPINAERGFTRALQLFLDLAPGARITSKLVQWGTDGKGKAIKIDASRMQGIIGTAIAPKDAATILTNLGCAVRIKKSSRRSQLTAHSSQLLVTPPPHRLRDLTMEMDIIEEIARLSGYAHIPPAMPTAEVRIPVRDSRIHTFRDALKEEGFTEVVPLSLLSSALLKKCAMNPEEAVAVQYPLSEDTALLQTSTLPGLFENAQRNILNTRDAIATFHWGHVFGKKMTEHAELSMLLASLTETNTANDPFLRLKRSLDYALDRSGYSMSISPPASPPPYAHPGRTALIVVQSEVIGMIFEIHPTVRARFDLPHRAAALTIDLDALLKLAPTVHTAQSLPHFPAITYDFTLTRTQVQPFGQLLSKLQKSDPLLEDVSVHDLYAGPPLKSTEYNITLRCTYRSPERTLTEEEAKKAHEKTVAMAMEG